jgi:hypothetical protein
VKVEVGVETNKARGGGVRRGRRGRLGGWGEHWEGGVRGERKTEISCKFSRSGKGGWGRGGGRKIKNSAKTFSQRGIIHILGRRCGHSFPGQIV